MPQVSSIRPVSGSVDIDIPARGEYVVLCRLALAGLLRDRGFSEETVADLKLAISEACTNSVRHAYPDPDEEAGRVRVSFTVREDRVIMVVRDEGCGFDESAGLDTQPLPDGSLVAGEGGMGMSLIRAVVDDFLLEHPASGGTCLTLTKRCDA